VSERPTPETDANEVDLHECISTFFIEGRREYVIKYVPSNIARSLERQRDELTEALYACIEHMEHSTPQGREAWHNAVDLLARIDREKP